MFLFKKIISPLLLPVPFCLLLLTTGLILLWFTRKQKAGKIFVSVGVVLLTLLSYSAIPSLFLKSLEYDYPPIISISEVTRRNPASSIKWIVVLGGGHTSSPQLPSTSQLSSASLVRLVEGIRLHRELPGSKLILSEGSIWDRASGAEVMAKVAQSLGVDSQNIVLEASSKDTEDEARLILPVIGKDEFILVTSASHMPRAMALFTKMGMNPIPAPTDYWTKEVTYIHPGLFYPNATGLRKAETALYEYWGMAWAKLRGKI